MLSDLQRAVLPWSDISKMSTMNNCDSPSSLDVAMPPILCIANFLWGLWRPIFRLSVSMPFIIQFILNICHVSLNCTLSVVYVVWRVAVQQCFLQIFPSNLGSLVRRSTDSQQEQTYCEDLGFLTGSWMWCCRLCYVIFDACVKTQQHKSFCKINRLTDNGAFCLGDCGIWCYEGAVNLVWVVRLVFPVSPTQ